MNVEVNQKGKKGLRARVVLVVALAFLACMLNASFVFGQTGSTVNDSSTNSNEGTIYGATLDDGGKMVKALSLDGVDDYFNLGSPANLDLGTGDFSISAWIKTTGSSQRDIVTDYNTAGVNKGYFFIVTTASALQGNIYDPSVAQVISTSGIIKDNTWHHAVFTQTRSSTTGLKLYLDGAETAYSLQNNPTAIGSITILMICNQTGLIWWSFTTGTTCTRRPSNSSTIIGIKWQSPVISTRPTPRASSTTIGITGCCHICISNISLVWLVEARTWIAATFRRRRSIARLRIASRP